MAKERIYITEVKEKDDCPFDEVCKGYPKLCDGCNVLPTRAEAIEKMAKAISKAFLDDKGNPQGATDKELAEAALDALLGE